MTAMKTPIELPSQLQPIAMQIKARTQIFDFLYPFHSYFF